MPDESLESLCRMFRKRVNDSCNNKFRKLCSYPDCRCQTVPNEELEKFKAECAEQKAKNK